ncbi:hypothetical protein ACWGI8_22265 [Streptomyces sp. NPDC054841]
MRRNTLAVAMTAVAATAAATALLTACGSGPEPDPAACKKALTAQLEKSATTTAGRPAACDGLDDRTFERVTGDARSDHREHEKAVDDIEGSIADTQKEADEANAGTAGTTSP